MQPAPAQLPYRRGIGAIRVSREHDGTTSPEVQKYAIETHAAIHNIRIIEWVVGVDEGKYSGSRRKSKWWAKLDYAVEQIEQHNADVIVVWKFSRTARQRLKWAVALDRVDVAGGAIESANEPTENNPSGRLHRGMLGEFNAYQAEVIGESWRETHDRRRRNGLTAEGGQRYGYTHEKGTPDYHPHPVEAPVLQEMYRRAVAGEGFASIARWANTRGHHTRGGNTWSRTVVVHLLDSGFAAGKIIQRPTGRDEKRDWNPLHATYHDGAHPALIDEDTWRQYLARRAEAPSARPPSHGGHMLSGLVRCGECGYPMHVGRNHADHYYRCSRATSTGQGMKLSMMKKHVETLVAEWVFALPDNIDELARITAEQERARVRHIDDHAAITALLKRNQQRAVNLNLRSLDKPTPDPIDVATMDALERERVSLEQRLANATKPRPVIDLSAIVPPLIENWHTMTGAERNRVLQRLIGAVVVKRPARQGGGVWRERVVIVPHWDLRDDR